MHCLRIFGQLYIINLELIDADVFGLAVGFAQNVGLNTAPTFDCKPFTHIEFRLRLWFLIT